MLDAKHGRAEREEQKPWVNKHVMLLDQVHHSIAQQERITRRKQRTNYISLDELDGLSTAVPLCTKRISAESLDCE